MGITLEETFQCSRLKEGMPFQCKHMLQASSCKYMYGFLPSYWFLSTGKFRCIVGQLTKAPLIGQRKILNCLYTGSYMKYKNISTKYIWSMKKTKDKIQCFICLYFERRQFTGKKVGNQGRNKSEYRQRHWVGGFRHWSSCIREMQKTDNGKLKRIQNYCIPTWVSSCRRCCGTNFWAL